MRPARNNDNPDLLGYEKYLHAEHYLRGGPQAFLPVVVRKTESAIRPRAEVSSAIDVLANKIDREVVHVLLSAETEEEIRRVLDDALPEFIELTRTLTHLLTVDSSVDSVLAMADETAEHAIDWLCKEAGSFSGPSAAEEARFAAETYAAAVHASRRVIKLTKEASGDKAKQTRVLARSFRLGTAFHELGALLIVALANGRRGTPAAIKFAFGSLRGGALHAYSAARQAEVLLSGEKPVGEPLPFDDEDYQLADSY